MLTMDSIDLLQCPTCHSGGLAAEATQRDGGRILEGRLRCEACGEAYPVGGGIPDLRPRDALTGREWNEWERHLEKLQARRMLRTRSPRRLVARWSRKAPAQDAFVRFIGCRSGRLLDVGCGPGKLLFGLDRAVDYYGLDPLALPEVKDIPFFRGVAEHLPFRDGTFTDVVVKSALDHFRDLDAFLSETSRVLGSHGRLHILQTVHGVSGPISALRMLAHKVKDALEERSTGGNGAPKHLRAFSASSLFETLSGRMRLVRSAEHGAGWYMPTKLFLTLEPEHDHPARTPARDDPEASGRRRC